MMGPDTFMADLGIGECFLNFPLHSALQELSGVDLIKLFSGDGKLLWEGMDKGINWV